MYVLEGEGRRGNGEQLQTISKYSDATETTAATEPKGERVKVGGRGAAAGGRGVEWTSAARELVRNIACEARNSFLQSR